MFVLYCDGVFFIGDCEKLLEFNDKFFYFWGWWIFDVFLDEFFWRGMDKVFEIILSGLLVGVFFVMVYFDYIWMWVCCLLNVFVCVFVDVGFFLDELLFDGDKIMWYIF